MEYPVIYRFPIWAQASVNSFLKHDIDTECRLMGNHYIEVTEVHQGINKALSGFLDMIRIPHLRESRLDVNETQTTWVDYTSIDVEPITTVIDIGPDSDPKRLAQVSISPWTKLITNILKNDFKTDFDTSEYVSDPMVKACVSNGLLNNLIESVDAIDKRFIKGVIKVAASIRPEPGNIKGVNWNNEVFGWGTQLFYNLGLRQPDIEELSAVLWSDNSLQRFTSQLVDDLATACAETRATLLTSMRMKNIMPDDLQTLQKLYKLAESNAAASAAGYPQRIQATELTLKANAVVATDSKDNSNEADAKYKPASLRL